MILQAPVPLAAGHDASTFCSGVQSLDQWPRQRALRDQASGATRTFVVCQESRVLAYYALASNPRRWIR